MFYIFYSNVIWGCIISALCGAGAVTAFFLLRGNKGSRAKKTIDDAKPSAKKDIIIGLRDNCDYFADLYEPVYAVACGSTGRMTAVFDVWNTRVATSETSTAFKMAFAAEFGDTASFKGKPKKFIKAAKKLVKYAFKAGILRDDAANVECDNTTAEKYDIAGIATFEPGRNYDVLAPYWYLGEEVVSKGVIR